MDNKLTWRDVLDGGKIFHGSRLKVYEVAVSAGYEYFTFNDRIYAVSNDCYYDTGLWCNCLN